MRNFPFSQRNINVGMENGTAVEEQNEAQVPTEPLLTLVDKFKSDIDKLFALPDLVSFLTGYALVGS